MYQTFCMDSNHQVAKKSTLVKEINTRSWMTEQGPVFGGVQLFFYPLVVRLARCLLRNILHVGPRARSTLNPVLAD